MVSLGTKGHSTKNFLNPASERTAIMKAVEEYPSLDLEYEQSVIFDPHNKPTSDERV